LFKFCLVEAMVWLTLILRRCDSLLQMVAMLPLFSWECICTYS